MIIIIIIIIVTIIILKVSKRLIINKYIAHISILNDEIKKYHKYKRAID